MLIRSNVRALVLTASLLIVSSRGLGQPEKVAFREDHTVLVKDRPFFPIGLYYCGEEFEDPSGRLLKALREYGFNTAGFYRAELPGWKAELDRAHEHGLKVWIRGHNGLAIDSPEIEKRVREQVQAIRSHPALLFWEFQDEPILNKVSIENSRKGYQLVKKEDPNHPMLVVEWPGATDRFHLWKGIGDIFATDLYPIPREKKYGRLPNHDITQMRDYLQVLKETHPDRPRLLVLQAWAWAPLKDGERGYPTVQESRFMAYQSVIHGAKGLFYYGQLHCSKPNSAAALWSEAKDPAQRKAEFEKCLALNKQFWDRHRGFFRELNDAGHVFVLPAAKNEENIAIVEATPGPAAKIESATRQGMDGALYLLAVNAENKERQATFRLPAGCKATEIHVLFENRKLPIKDGVFRDVFKAYDTHVYGTVGAVPK